MIFLGFLLLLGLLTIGYFAAKKLREISSVPFIDFLRRLSSGAKERDVDVVELQKMLNNGDGSQVLIDLRETDLFEAGHIDGAVSLPFDDFMQEVLVNEKYDPTQKLILICDHGMKSKVAADILGEDEGFSSVYSVRDGMEAWKEFTKPDPCCVDLLRKEGFML